MCARNDLNHEIRHSVIDIKVMIDRLPISKIEREELERCLHKIEEALNKHCSPPSKLVAQAIKS